MNFRPSEYFAAIAAPFASVSLTQVNQVVGILSFAVSGAYIGWKWHKEWKAKKTTDKVE